MFYYIFHIILKFSRTCGVNDNDKKHSTLVIPHHSTDRLLLTLDRWTRPPNLMLVITPSTSVDANKKLIQIIYTVQQNMRHIHTRHIRFANDDDEIIWGFCVIYPSFWAFGRQIVNTIYLRDHVYNCY